MTGASLQHNFYIANQHHVAVLLNTFTRQFSCFLLQVPCTHTCDSRAVEGMVVTGTFRRAPDPSCSYFTFANIYMNNESAKRRSVCIALLHLIRDLCSKLCAVVLTGDSARPSNGSSRLETPTDNAVFQWLKRPSITAASRGRHTACRHCGAPVQSLTATGGLTVVWLIIITITTWKKLRLVW